MRNTDCGIDPDSSSTTHPTHPPSHRKKKERRQLYGTELDEELVNYTGDELDSDDEGVGNSGYSRLSRGNRGEEYDT